MTSSTSMHAVERFSTRGLTPDRRTALWEDHNARALVGLACRPLTEAPLEATETTLRLPSLTFAHVTANAHVVERSQRQISRSPLDGFAVYFTLAGESVFSSRSGVQVQRPGDVFACDTAEPFLRGFAQGVQEFVLTVPRVVFADLGDRSARSRPMWLSGAAGANAAAAALASLLRRSLSGQEEQEPGATEAAALALLRATLAPGRSRGAEGYRQAALAVIDRRLGDPTLSVGSIAAEVGISARQLARSFADADTGVARTLLDRRLDLAMRLLSDPRRGRTVTEVAHRCGFASHSHFTRSFHARFGTTPSAARVQATG